MGTPLLPPSSSGPHPQPRAPLPTLPWDLGPWFWLRDPSQCPNFSLFLSVPTSWSSPKSNGRVMKKLGSVGARTPCFVGCVLSCQGAERCRQGWGGFRMQGNFLCPIGRVTPFAALRDNFAWGPSALACEVGWQPFCSWGHPTGCPRLPVCPGT